MKNLLRPLALSALTLTLLSACSHVAPEMPPPAPLREVPTVLRQPRPAPIETKPVEFGSAVVDGVPVLTLTADAAENLRLNIAEFGRWAVEAIARLDYYDEAAEKP